MQQEIGNGEPTSEMSRYCSRVSKSLTKSGVWLLWRIISPHTCPIVLCAPSLPNLFSSSRLLFSRAFAHVLLSPPHPFLPIHSSPSSSPSFLSSSFPSLGIFALIRTSRTIWLELVRADIFALFLFYGGMHSVFLH